MVEQLAQKYFVEIKKNKRIDISRDSNVQAIDLDSVKNKNASEVGIDWLCKQTNILL